MDRFEHRGFLIQFGDKGSEGNSFSQSSFFANSDHDMPTIPVPASQVHDWLLQNIASALGYIAERTSKENGPASASDQDVAMTDACTLSVKVSTSTWGASFSVTNREREKNILKGSSYSLPSPSHSDDVDDNISEEQEGATLLVSATTCFYSSRLHFTIAQV